MTQSVELFKWLIELNFFLNITQRIEPFFFEYDAKNWTLFEHDSKELNLFLSMIQRIESLSEYDSTKIDFFFEYDSMNRTHFFECDSKNWNFGWKNVKKFKIDFFHMTRRIGPAFFNMTQRIEPFLLCLGELIFLRLKELNFSSKYGSKELNLFLFSMSQRMGVFLVWLKELNFLMWIKDFNPFFSNTRRVAPFSFNTTQRVEPFFFQYDAKNWTLFFEYDAKKWTPFSFIWRKELKHLFDQEIWLKELNRVSKKDSKNGTLYKRLTHRIEPFYEPLLNMTQRVEVFFSIWREELNLSCFPIWLKELNFFQNAQGIEPLFHMNYFFTWLELNSFLINTTQRVEFFSKMTQSVEHLLEFDWKCWNFCIGLKELNFFQPYYSKNWAFFCMNPKFIFFKKKLISSQKKTQRIEPFRNMTHRIEFFETKKTHRIEPFFSLTEVNPSFQHESQYWTLLFNMTQRMIFFWLTQKNWIEFLEYDSKNWARIFSKMTRRIELFLEEWLKELNLVSKEKSQRVQLFFDYEVKNCFLSFSTWLEELNLFLICLKELSLFLEYDAQNWTFFSIWLKEFWTFQKIWLTELNLFCKKKMTQRIF